MRAFMDCSVIEWRFPSENLNESGCPRGVLGITRTGYLKYDEPEGEYVCLLRGNGIFQSKLCGDQNLWSHE